MKQITRIKGYLSMMNTPYAGVFAEIYKKKDHRLKLWISKAEFQLRLKSCNKLAPYLKGEDIVLEIIGGVLTGTIKWDTERVPNICTFMYHQIRSHVSNLSVKEMRRLHLSGAGADCVADYLLKKDLNDIPGDNPEEFVEQQELHEIRELILQDLEKDITAYFVFEEIISGSENRQAAEALGITISEVENAKKRIYRRVEKLKRNL